MLRQYGYFYDQMNRLRSAVYIKPESNTKVTNAYDERLEYDPNGNILQLQRNGYRDADDNLPLEIDRLAYAYNPNSNQLRSVADYSLGLDGFGDGITANLEYVYDSYGNMITDGNKGIGGITYNHLNLPVIIEFDNGSKISYLYDASGMKLRKTVSETNVQDTKTDYLNGFQYQDGELLFFPTAEGYVKHTDDAFNYVYNYTDHLGNNRLSYTWDAQQQQLEIMEENNYYPFGLKQQNYNVEKVDYKKVDVPGTFAVQLADVGRMAYQYKYNGKELQDELGLNLYDYGARNYDPALGRWMNMDPLAEQMRRWSPYNYCFNNPLRFVDPDGMGPTPPDEFQVSPTGKITQVPKEGEDVVVMVDKNGNSTGVTQNIGDGAQLMNGEGRMQVLVVNDQTKADEAFKAISKHASLEYAKIEYTENGTNAEKTVLMTNGRRSEVSATTFAKGIEDQGVGVVTTIDHDHPDGSTPSGYDSETGANMNPNNPTGDANGPRDLPVNAKGQEINRHVYDGLATFIRTLS